MEEPNVPKWSLTVIDVCAFGGTFPDVYSKLEPFSNNDIEITEAIPLFNDREFKVIPCRVED